MKITIEKEFTSAGEAAAWLQRIIGGTGSTVTVIPPRLTLASATGEDRPARKPRNDAGKPRGSYLEKAAAKVNGESASALEPRADILTVPNVSATPPQSEAKTEVSAQVSSTVGAISPTKEDALAALKRMSLKEGFGTPACVAHLKEFKVNRLSDLDSKHYPLFIKQIDDKLAAGE